MKSKNLYKKIIPFIILIFLSSLNIYGQGKRVLTLQEAIDIALRESYTVKSFQQDVIMNAERYRSQRANFRPYANFNVRTPSFMESVNAIYIPESPPIYQSRGNLQFDSSFDFNYVIPTGGTFTLSSSLQRARNDVYQKDNQGNYTLLRDNKVLTNMRLGFRQPIFTDNTLKEGLQQAEYNYERSLRNFNRNERDIIFNVTNAFFNLYRATRQLEIYRDRMNNSLDAYTLAQMKYEAGIIPEVQALQLQVDKAQSEANYIAAVNALDGEKDSFKQLIGLSLDEDIEVIAEIEYIPFEIDLSKALEEGLKNRSEIRVSELNIELSKINVQSTKRQKEFKGDINLYYDFTGVSSDPTDLWRTSLDDFWSRPPNRGITLTFSYPIIDWGRNSARVQSALASLKDSELSLENQKISIEKEIRDVVRNVKESEDRLEILRIAQEVAQKSYDISKERFDNGDITSQELARDQEALTNTQLNNLNAFLTYQRNVADLKRKTMWDFEKNESYLKDTYISE